MSSFADIYKNTIDQAYYIASFLMRDEKLTLEVLLESYRSAFGYKDMLGDADREQQHAVMNRIVAAQSLETLRLSDAVSYQSFYGSSDSSANVPSDYTSVDALEEFQLKDAKQTSVYERAAGRFVTTLKLQPQPQSDAAFLHYHIGMSIPEISAAMDVSEETVEEHLSVSNQKLTKDASNWIKQGRVPDDIEPLSFLCWALKRDEAKGHYGGPNLLDQLRGLERRAEMQQEVRQLRKKQKPAAEEAGPKKEKFVYEVEEDLPAEKEVIPVNVEEETDTARSEVTSEVTAEEVKSEGMTGLPKPKGNKKLSMAIACGVLSLLVIFGVARALQNQNAAKKALETAQNTEQTENSEQDDAKQGEDADDTKSEDSKDSEDSKKDLDSLEDPDAYIIPDSDSRYLTAEEVEAMDWKHLRLAINELYARHGRIFGNGDVQDYFDSKTWYEGTVPKNKWTDTVFNEYERANLKLMLQYNGNH